MRKFYIASSSHDFEHTHRSIVELEATNRFECTYDWTKHFREQKTDTNAERVIKEQGMADALRLQIAMKEQSAVLQANVIWLKVSPEQMRGSWTEWGMACMARRCGPLQERKLIVSGDRALVRLNIFTSMADFTFDSHGEVIEFLVGRR